MKRLTVFLCLSSIVVGSTTIQGTAAAKQPTDVALPAQQGEVNWHAYTADDEEFSVSLPELPAVSTYSPFLMRLGRKRKERLMGAYADGVVYAVYSFENPKPRQSLDDFIVERRRVNSLGKEFSFQRDLAMKGFSGKQYRLSDMSTEGVIQFYLTPEHLYEFEAIGADEKDSRVTKFFSLLSLGGQLTGNRVKDGTGALLPDVPSDGSLSTDVNVDSDKRTFTGKEVDRKIILVTKPEPTYTEVARQHQVTGTVVLKVALSSRGRVTNIHTVVSLPDGLTEQAIFAARQIRFVPALKDGRFVSMWIQLEYNFNLY
jgi:TonB family protein